MGQREKHSRQFSIRTGAVLPIAPAIWTPRPGGWRWFIPVCPICGGRHEHARCGLARCYDAGADPAPYRMVEVQDPDAAALLRVSLERYPFRVIGASGNVLSRHFSRFKAFRALGDARKYDRLAELVDVRLVRLAEVLGAPKVASVAAPLADPRSLVAAIRAALKRRERKHWTAIAEAMLLASIRRRQSAMAGI